MNNQIICCICNKPISGQYCDPWPIVLQRSTGKKRCCENCLNTVVDPVRMQVLRRAILLGSRSAAVKEFQKQLKQTTD